MNAMLNEFLEGGEKLPEFAGATSMADSAAVRLARPRVGRSEADRRVMAALRPGRGDNPASWEDLSDISSGLCFFQSQSASVCNLIPLWEPASCGRPILRTSRHDSTLAATGDQAAWAAILAPHRHRLAHGACAWTTDSEGELTRRT